MTESHPKAEPGFAHLGSYLKLLESRASRARQGESSENANAECIQKSIGIQGEDTSSELQQAPVDSDPEQFAHFLATTFGDLAFRNLPFYRLVAKLPRTIVLDALQRAKDAQNIRKSRAHLFAFLVRGHLPRRSRSSFTNHEL
jgi:hypothetical protein